MFFSYQGKDLSVDIKWEIKILANKQISACAQEGTRNPIAVELPLGFWKMSEPSVDFEMEMKTPVNILLSIMELKKSYNDVSIS